MGMVRKPKEDGEILDKAKLLAQEPHLYQVILLNDDFTPRDFVTLILQEIFQLNRAQATAVMQEAHDKGQACCGVFVKDLAETKVCQAERMAQEFSFPLHFELARVL